jgi:hypothetical protein
MRIGNEMTPLRKIWASFDSNIRKIWAGFDSNIKIYSNKTDYR